jgi:hypothetical protein
MTAASPHMHSLRYISPLNYQVEPEVNHSMELTVYSYLQAVDNNTIYAGPTGLTTERQSHYDKSV